MRIISWKDYMTLIDLFCDKILAEFPNENTKIVLYGIPRGGNIVASILAHRNPRFKVDTCKCHLKPDSLNTVIIDDVLETGKTREKYLKYIQGGVRFAVLFDKSFNYDNTDPADISGVQLYDKEWLLFPYEKSEYEQTRSNERKESK